MRVQSESFSVLATPDDGTISLVIAGLRIVFNADEARRLRTQLIGSMHAIDEKRVPDRLASRRDLALAEAAPMAQTSAAKASATANTGANAVAVAASAALVPLTRAMPVPAENIGAAEERKAASKLRALLKVLGKEDRGAYSSG
ncbi:MAG TPA: hypothetical protein VFA50_09295 [Stellaceae bacterium]|nr:hypothetical protein [Stellaceae bacterium]